MNGMIRRTICSAHPHLIFVSTTLLLFLAFAGNAVSNEYPALQGVERIKAVFDVSTGSPKAAPVVFWAVRNAYSDKAVTSLDKEPQVAVVFHGQAVKLISTNRDGFTDEEKQSLDRFAEMIRQMKAEGVVFEACLYAAKVLNVDPATLLPEIDPVGNGFISVIGYQSQGYSVVRIP